MSSPSFHKRHTVFAFCLGFILLACFIILSITMAVNANAVFGWVTIAIPVIFAIIFWIFEHESMTAATLGVCIALIALACVLRFIRIPLEGIQFTSWLVILAGLSFGSESGLFVGTMVPFISNFWLGQGSWTPWEMLGWGAIGIITGRISHMSWTRNRWVMALYGLCTGWVYGFILNVYSFLYMRTLTWGMFWSAIGYGVGGDTLSGLCTGVLLFISLPWSVALIRRVRKRNTMISEISDETHSKN